MKSHSPMKSHTIVWEFDQPPDVIWPLFADTGRINEAAGLPKHRIREVEQADGTVRFFAEAKAGPFTLAWEEIPVEWVTDRWFRHERRFSRGPLAVLIATAEFEPTPGGCRCIYRMEAAPANLIGRLLLATRFFDDAGKNFDRLVDDLRRFAAGASKRPFLTKRVALDQARALRLERIVAEINASPNGHGLGTRLADYVLDAQEMDLIRMRPRRLAREWGEEDLPVIELCLEAVRDGLLESRWDLLCPRCRGAKLSASSLDQVPETAHCDSCNITYDRDFSRNVELSFQPAPAVRPVQDGEFCLFGPMSMPHVILQVALDPGESRTVPADLAPGAYRYRTLETGGQCDVAIDGPAPQVIVNGAVVQAGEPSAPGTVTLENTGESRRTPAELHEALAEHGHVDVGRNRFHRALVESIEPVELVGAVSDAGPCDVLCLQYGDSPRPPWPSLADAAAARGGSGRVVTMGEREVWSMTDDRAALGLTSVAPDARMTIASSVGDAVLGWLLDA